MPFQVACCTHRGSPHRQQDALLIDAGVHQSDDWCRELAVNEDEVLVAIADGLASSPNSGFISRALLKELSSVLEGNPEWRREGLLSNRHLREAQARLGISAARRPRLRSGAATTVVVAHVQPGRAVVMNCGDSRAYLRTAGAQVRQVSLDHTELQRLIDAGQAEAGVQYASFYDMLTDYVCADPDEADFAIHRVETAFVAGDLLVLCSDGVHDILGDARWKAMLGNMQAPADLVSAARAAILRAGAPDNFTLVALSARAVG